MQKKRERWEARQAAEEERRKEESVAMFYRQLEAAGVRHDDIAAIVRDHRLLDDVAQACKKSRFLSDPHEVIETFLELNERVWKDPQVSPEAIGHLGAPPVVPSSDECGLYAPVLLRDTGNLIETLSANMAAFRYMFGDAVVSDNLNFTEAGVRLSRKARPRPVGLRWEIVELGRGTSCMYPPYMKKVLEVLGIMGIGPELPLIAAEHKRWVQSINTERPFDMQRPSVAATDLDVYIDGIDWNAGVELYRSASGSEMGLATFGTRSCINAGCGSFRRSPIDWVAAHKAMPSGAYY